MYDWVPLISSKESILALSKVMSSKYSCVCSLSVHLLAHHNTVSSYEDENKMNKRTTKNEGKIQIENTIDVNANEHFRTLSACTQSI